jgi:hypothetical protein
MIKASIIYLLVFSFLLAGCYTTEQYSDTPENIISGKSVIKQNEDFVMDKIVLKSDSTIRMNNFITRFIECNKDTCSKFVYRSRDLVCDTIKTAGQNSIEVRCKEPVTDTISVSKIKKMHYQKNEFDSGSSIFIAAILLIVPVGYAVITSIWRPIDPKH